MGNVFLIKYKMEKEPNLRKDLELNLLVAFQYFFSSLNRTFEQNIIDLELSLKSKNMKGLNQILIECFRKYKSNFLFKRFYSF